MKDTHTIIIPQLSPIHIHLMKEALAAEGYKVKVLETTDRNDIEWLPCYKLYRLVEKCIKQSWFKSYTSAFF